jgi:uncharacterized protein YciI
MHYLLCYDLAPDYLDRRGEFRNEHLQLAWQAKERGELVLAGALSDPADTAMLIFQGDSPDAAERFAKADPYVTKGLVLSYKVRQWNTVVGDAACSPVRPA